MCGFAGFVQLQEPLTESARPILAAMSLKIEHRGPDGAGEYQDAHCALAHRRLSIIDFAGGAQPWLSRDKQLCLCFNGEIYNHRELRQQLTDKGYQYQSHCDTETLLYAYQEWGERCVDHFRGMFAFVIWDSATRRLFGARDRLGLKPLYYYRDEDTLLFASELKALLVHPAIAPKVDQHALANYLRLGYYPAPQTPIANVLKLPPATTLRFDARGLALSNYWNLADFVSDGKDIIAYDEAVAGVRERLQAAVRYRLESEVPLGAFLSGGIDSSVISYMASQGLGHPLKTHCVSFDFVNLDESAHAKEVAKLIGAEHCNSHVEGHFTDDLEKILWHMDEPTADDSAIPTYYLCRDAKQRMSVALSGDGGDEVFAGYDWYTQLVKNQQMTQQIPALVQGCIRPFFGNGRFASLRGVNMLGSLGLAPALQHQALRSLFNDAQISALLSAGTREISVAHPIAEAYRQIHHRVDLISDAQAVDMKLYLAEDILMKVDKMSMAHGLEVRAPLLDHKLIEYCVGVPAAYKNDGTNTKRILKDLVGGILPKQLVARRKQGFSTPLAQWLQKDLLPLVEHYLLAQGPRSGLFDPRMVKQLWMSFKAQQQYPRIYVNSSRLIWALLSFEIWHSLYIAQN